MYFRIFLCIYRFSVNHPSIHLIIIGATIYLLQSSSFLGPRTRVTGGYRQVDFFMGAKI